MQPSINRSLKIDPEIFLFELDLKALQAGIVPKFNTLSKFPSVRRDLSIIVDERVTIFLFSVLRFVINFAGILAFSIKWRWIKN